MGGKLGVTNVKKVMTTLKLGTISVFQAVSKDGFQASDIVAPLKSKVFQDAVVTIAVDFRSAVIETKELDWGDNLEIVEHSWACFKDVKTEFVLALKKIQGQTK